MSEKIKTEYCEICGWPHLTEKHAQILEEGLKLKNRNPEIVAEAEKEGPATLDIVKIDGRWAQVISAQQSGIKIDGDSTTLRWLDNKSGDSIDITDYRLKIYANFTASMFRQMFSDIEFENIHWGEDDTLELKGKVTVFGEYVSKNSPQ